MKLELPPQQLAPISRAPWTMRRFAAVLAVLLLAACALAPPKHYGDALEYTLTTTALANHGTPDIRLSDVLDARALLPELAGSYDTVAAGLRAGAAVPIPGLLRGADGGMYAIHFFAYPALAAVPFDLLRLAGASPFRCYLVLNSAALLVLGLALLRLFGNALRAAAGLLAFLLCGGMLYWQWSSPEFLSAAALLAALALYLERAPVPGGVLAGLAALQNPSIALFCAFAPLLQLAAAWRPGAGWAGLRHALTGRHLAGAATCAAVFAPHVLFNLHEFGVPSIIAKVATSRELATLNRLHSFFFDLNQGMIVGVPALALALLCWRPLRARALLLAACAFAIAMAVPTLGTQNWNSGSAGIMRYTAWASMPLLFAFVWRLKVAARWPAGLVALLLAGQAVAMAHASRYNELVFSPLAERVMAIAPGWYNPDPDIFWDRLRHYESYPMPGETYTYQVNGRSLKSLYNASNRRAAEQLCGPGRTLAPDIHYVDADLGWRYINGPVRCAGPR